MRTNKAYPIIIFGVSFLLGCIFLSLSTRYQQVNDALGFIRQAKDIASCGIWKIVMEKEPGYSILASPLFRLFSESTAIMLARVLNVFLIAISSGIFYLTIRILMPHASMKRVFIFGLMFALSPQLSSFSALRVYSEPLQVFLNSIILFCLIKILSNKNGPWSLSNLKFWVIAAIGMSWLITTKAFFLIYPFWMVLFIIIYSISFYKMRQPALIIVKPVMIFLCLSLFLPLLLNVRDPVVAARGCQNLLAQAYSVDLSLKDSFKWGVFQLSDNLGKSSFPKDAERMDKQFGEPISKSYKFINNFDKGNRANIASSTLAEWRRIVLGHPFKYTLFYCLNALNNILLEGVYADFKAMFGNHAYFLSVAILHFLYSIFIWGIITAAIFMYAAKSGMKSLFRVRPEYMVIVISLGYFYFFAYHFHIEMRYFYPFYINVYMLFALSWKYLLKE